MPNNVAKTEGNSTIFKDFITLKFKETIFKTKILYM